MPAAYGGSCAPPRPDQLKRDPGKRKAHEEELGHQEPIKKKQLLQPSQHGSSTDQKLDPSKLNNAVWWEEWENKNEENIAGYLGFDTIGDFRMFMSMAIVLKNFLPVVQYLPGARTRCLELLRDNGLSEDFELEVNEFFAKYPVNETVDTITKESNKGWRLAYHVRNLTIVCQSSGFLETAKKEEDSFWELRDNWDTKIKQGPVVKVKLHDFVELPAFGPHKNFDEHDLEANNRILVLFHIMSLATKKHIFERLFHDERPSKLVFAKPAYMEEETSPQRCELIMRFPGGAASTKQPYSQAQYNTMSFSDDIWKQEAKEDARSCTEARFRDLLRCQFELWDSEPNEPGLQLGSLWLMDLDKEVQLFPPERRELSWEDCHARIAHWPEVKFVFEVRALAKGEELFEMPHEPPRYLFRKSIMTDGRLVDDPYREQYCYKRAIRLEKRLNMTIDKARRHGEETRL